MWPMLSTILEAMMSEPHIMQVASHLVNWSIRWQIFSLFAGMVGIVSQTDNVGAPSTLLGLVIAVCLGMLAVLTWTVKELLRINERHADNVRILAAKVRQDGENLTDGNHGKT